VTGHARCLHARQGSTSDRNPAEADLHLFNLCKYVVLAP
jgi:hypothetical protein